MDKKFKIGDRIKNNHWPFQPAAIVTEITEKGFKYKLTENYPFIPRWGMYFDKDSEHESFTYDGWRLEEDNYEV
jgi:hypothetical protein